MVPGWIRFRCTTTETPVSKVFNQLYLFFYLDVQLISFWCKESPEHKESKCPHVFFLWGHKWTPITTCPWAPIETSPSWQGLSQVDHKAACRALSWVPTEGPSGPCQGQFSSLPVVPLSRGLDWWGERAESRLAFGYLPSSSLPPSSSPDPRS